MDDDIGLRLMRLYMALRSSRTTKAKDAIKAEIDALVAEAHASIEQRPMVAGSAHESRKFDA